MTSTAAAVAAKVVRHLAVQNHAHGYRAALNTMATAQTNDRVRPEQVAAVLAVTLVARLRRARIDPDQWATQLQDGGRSPGGQPNGERGRVMGRACWACLAGIGHDQRPDSECAHTLSDGSTPPCCADALADQVQMITALRHGCPSTPAELFAEHNEGDSS